ncbi:hypothetical protein AURDEDRAFT_112605, partial [Auricularia subglabra TFB-10046 SS5]
IRNTVTLQIDDVLVQPFVETIGRLPGMEDLKIMLTASMWEWGICSAFPFDAHLDAPLYPRLHDLELYATHGPVGVPVVAFEILSAALTPRPDGVLRLWLSNGAYVPAYYADIWGLFDSVSFDSLDPEA